MESNRRFVLQLVAMGRVTPAEAERLLLACAADRETLLVLAGAAVLYVFTQVVPVSRLLAAQAHVLAPQVLITIQHAHTLATHLLGGIL